MKVKESKESQIGDESILGLVAQIKDLSDEIKISHGDKATKTSDTIPNFLWVLKEGKNIAPKRFEGKIADFNYSLKKENESGTGYECDNDDGRDEQFQNE